MSLNILNSNTKSSRKAKILPQFSISSENKPLLDLLEIQRKSFFDFLQHGIPHELAKIAVFREIAKNSTCKQELELKFNPETYKFISPNFTPKEAILNGKTYACKVYVQATLMIRSPYDIQKTNLVQSSALQSVVQKEKVKQKLNFYPSFADKNKRLNASKLLHNTYTKWLQSPFVYGDSLQSFALQSSLSEPLTLTPPTFGLTNNGSATKKQRKNFYSLSLNTDSLTHNKSSIWVQSQVDTTQLGFLSPFGAPRAIARGYPHVSSTPYPVKGTGVPLRGYPPTNSIPDASFAALTGYKGFLRTRSFPSNGVPPAGATPCTGVPLEFLRNSSCNSKRKNNSFGVLYKSSIYKKFLRGPSCNSKRKNHSSTQNIQIFHPWIFLGELPLMTKRGHFILNGSPRVIVNQIARCPGIYFQEKRRGVGIEQEIRVSADLIPQRGPWLRVQSDWEGRFWARLKQEGRVKYATLYEAFQEFEKEYNPPLICLLSNSTNVPPVSARVIPTSSLFSKSETATFQERKIKEDRQKKALIRLFKNSSRYSLGKLGRSRVNERIHFTFTRPPHKEITSLTSYGDLNKINLNWESEAGEKPVLLKGSVNKANKNKELRSFLNENNLLLSHEDNQRKISEKSYYFYPLLQQHEEDFVEILEESRKNSEGVILPQQDEPLLPQQEELMAKDLDAIHTCLERLLEGQGFTDDIDNLKNRFIRTSGKLLQQQFELGLFRLNEVIMPLLGNLLPNYSRLTKSKDSTNKNIKGIPLPFQSTAENPLPSAKQSFAKGIQSFALQKGMELALQDANLVDKLNKVKSTKVSNKDTNSSLNTSSNDSSINSLPFTGYEIIPRAIAREKIIPFASSIPDSSFATLTRYKFYKSDKWYKSSIWVQSKARINQSARVSSWGTSKGMNSQLRVRRKPFTGYRNSEGVSMKITLQRSPFTLTEYGVEKFCCLKGNTKFQSWQTKQPKNKNLMYLNLTSVLTNLKNRRFVPFVRAEESVAEKFGYLPLRQQKELGKYNSCPSKRSLLQIFDLQRADKSCASMRITPQRNSVRRKAACSQKALTGYRTPSCALPFQGTAESPLQSIELNNSFSCNSTKNFKKVNESLTDGSSKEVSLIQNAPFRWLRTSKPINSAFREFFGSNPLSQYMDQTNPLAEITHKRRLSSMGPGGIKRETAGMEVRGIHPTHYGRVCPIETPEGKNAGLVNSPTVYSRVGNYGFLETPLYQVIENQVQTKRWTFFSAQHEEKQNSSLATCDTGLLQFNFLAHVPIPVQTANNPLTHFQQIERHRVGYRALSPIQAISIATALIPFLEHDDANRALMGSNMQRQAIPLLSPERPIVGTGFEPLVVMESGQALQATKLGCVSQADATSIIVHTKYSIEKPLPQPVLTRYHNSLTHNKSSICTFNTTPYPVKGFLRTRSWGVSSEFLSLAQLPYPVKGKEFLRDSFGVHTATDIDTEKEINLTKAQYLPKKGLLYKSKIWVLTPSEYSQAGANLTNQRFVPFAKNDAVIKNKNNYVNKKHISSSHNTFLLRPLKQDLQFYERSNQETCLNQRPLVQEGDWIQKGDFLADSSASHSGDLALGKNVTVAYMPWEGYNFEDAIVISDRLVSDDIYTSLHIERYEIKVSKNSQGKERITNRVPGSSHSLKHLDNFGIARISSWVQPGDILVGKVVELKRPLSPYERLAWELASRLSPKSPEREKWLNKVWLEDISLRLPSGVCGRVINSQIISTEYASMSDKEQTIYPQEVHLYLAVKRKIQIGDKLAGRHGNKGIVSAILPQEDMPYLGDGSCIDMVLNPLGVPSRMNLGQIFECLLGLAGSQLGCNFRITPFDEIAGGEASRSLVFLKLYQCRLMYKQQWLFTPTFPGKSKLFDGRTGEPFENWVTVGQAYMLKLIHMVDHKIHARSTGPYSLFTRQPVRGRSRRGGQRLGEMEVWAVEGFGAAYTLQEFLTIKSDDLKARTALQKGFYKQNDVTFGKIHIAPGNPEAFKVLVSELQALCLHIQM